MRFSARFRLLPLLVVALAMAEASPQPAAVLRSQSEPAPSNIVVGFVGGFVRHDNPYHGPVELAQRLRRTVPKDTYIQVFENRHRKRAYKTVIRLLDTNHDGKLSDEEKSRCRIIIFGHSWGAAAAVLLARDLGRLHIPVLLTVQVDSVAKPWQDDSVIPENVSEAVNFYQPHGLVHGRAKINAADPSKTRVLGNYLVDYRKNPVECPNPSWFDRYFAPSHAQSECDFHLWSQIEEMILQRLAPGTQSIARNP